MKILKILLLISCIIPSMLWAGITSIQQGDGRNITLTNHQGETRNLYMHTNVNYEIVTENDNTTQVKILNASENLFNTGDLSWKTRKIVSLADLHYKLFEQTEISITSANIIMVDQNQDWTQLRNEEEQISEDINSFINVNESVITSSNIVNGTIQNQDLADNSITSAKITNGSITHEKIANNSISGEKFANESLTMEKLAPSIRHEFKNLKQEMATQTALTMASQPLADKDITLNIGIGNFENIHAVAIGLNCKLNKQLTFAAGIGSDTDKNYNGNTTITVSF